MRRDGKHADINFALSDAAIEWIVKLTSGHATLADKEAFERWRSQSPEHEAAAREAEEIWEGVGAARDQIGEARKKLAKARMTRRKLIGGGVLLLAGAAVKISGVTEPRAFADYVTAVGEQRTIMLADGSSVMMNGYTALSVDFSQNFRNLTLHEGEATFTVAKDATRPFIVEANGGKTRAIGTVFDIDMRPNDTAVTVVEGKVVVTTSAGMGEVGAAADQRVRYTRRSGPTPAETVDASAETAWRRGKLIFNNRPLGDVIAELQRHRAGTIVIANAALRAMPVTGIFDISDPETVLDMIEETLPVTVTRLPIVTILR